MIEKRIKIITDEKTISEATIKLTPGFELMTVTLILNNGQIFEAADFDYFRALRTVRKKTDSLGIKLLIQGARPNCWPSGMSAQMSNGLSIYARSLEKPPRKWESVNLLDPADENQAGTVDEQNEFCKKLADRF